MKGGGGGGGVAAGVCAEFHDHSSGFLKGLCVYLCCKCVCWTSWSPLKVHEGSVCVFVLQVCVLNFMITPQSSWRVCVCICTAGVLLNFMITLQRSWRVCVCICTAGVCAELHDHPSKFMKGLCMYLYDRCVCWTSWSPLKVYEESVCIYMTGVCAELHDHPSKFMKSLCVFV